MGEPWFWNQHKQTKNVIADGDNDDNYDGSDGGGIGGGDDDDVSSHPTPQQSDLLWMVFARCQDAVPVVRVRAVGATPSSFYGRNNRNRCCYYCY